MIDVTEEHIDELFALNYKSVVNLTQLVTKKFIGTKSSWINCNTFVPSIVEGYKRSRNLL